MTESFIDATTRQVLGIDAYLDRLSPDSEPGQRRKRHPQWFGPDDLRERHDIIERRRRLDAWLENHDAEHERARDALGELPGIDELLQQLRAGKSLGEGLLFRLKQFLVFADKFISVMGPPIEAWSLDTATVTSRLHDLQSILHPDGVGDPTFQLSDALDETLADARSARDDARHRHRSRRRELENEITAEFGGSFGYDGTYRPPQNADDDAYAQDERLRKVRDGNAPRWQLNDAKLTELERAIEDAESEFRQEAERVRAGLSERIAAHTGWLGELQSTCGHLDIALAACRLRRELDGCWGKAHSAGDDVDRVQHTHLRGGREPAMANRLGDNLQPIDLSLDGPVCVLSGPNMGGKSKTLVLLGLCQWCAQHGLPIPADSFEFEPVRHIAYVGSEQPTTGDAFQSAGLSAFAREIRRVVTWLEASAPVSWLLDEVGRGTHPGDGADLLSSLLERLASDGHRVLATSHFPALASLDGVQHLQIRGLSDETELTELLDTDTGISEALRRAIDHQPVEIATGHVPRDARRVAQALGLTLPGEAMRDTQTNAEDERLEFGSKEAARDWVWTELRERGAARFPFPIRDRIPNFEGAEDAAARLFDETTLPDADAIKVNPDSPQKHVRRLALSHGITVFVPTPRLKGGFMKFDPNDIDEDDYEDASMLSRWDPYKQKVSLDSLPQLDAIVTGCVAVTPEGKRCGKGEGYSDLEYAILRELGHNPVPVFTTVHSLQVVEDFPTEAHDLSLAGIATQQDWLHISKTPAGPDAIDWERLTEEDLEEMPILEELRGKED